MSTSSLAKLDNQTVAVDLDVRGRRVELIGIAAYEKDSELGPTLRIHVEDPAGEFDLVLREDRWKGRVEESRQAGCHFRISLTASDLVSHHS